MTKASASSGLIQNLEPNWQLFGEMSIFNQNFFLDEVNDFNLEVRYPEYRREFYKKCTKDFAEPYFVRIKEMFQWIKSHLK